MSVRLALIAGRRKLKPKLPYTREAHNTEVSWAALPGNEGFNLFLALHSAGPHSLPAEAGGPCSDQRANSND